MSQKETQKKPEALIDEEKDFYLSFINKKLRNIRKKLDQIEELAKRDQSTLKSEQLEKINSRPEVLQSIKYYDDLKEVYYTAFKTAGEEAKQAQKESFSKKGVQNQAGAKVRKGSQEDGNTEESRKALREEIIRETVKKILDFTSISQILNSSSKRGELAKLYQSEDKDSYTEGLVHLNDVQELHKLIFTSLEDTNSERIEDRVNQSVERLTKYVSGDETYKSIQENVERIVNFSSYKNLTFAPKQQEVVQVTNPVVVTQEESVAPLPNAAAILKPDIDDFVHSPEKGRYLPKEPKVVRFVDEIERDMQSNQTKQREGASPQSAEGEIQVAKESKQPAEEQDETNEDPQEQKSFRKKKSDNDANYKKQPRGEYKSNGTPSNRGFNGNQKRYRNEGNYYQGRGNGSKYQYTEYVQKKPTGDQ